jgi:hypothetical protein
LPVAELRERLSARDFSWEARRFGAADGAGAANAGNREAARAFQRPSGAEAPAVPGLQTKRHVQVSPNGQFWRAHSERLFAQDLTQTYQVGRVIADGSAQKRVLALTSHPDAVLRSFKEQTLRRLPGARGSGQGAWDRAWIMIQEYHDLNFLKQRGFPVMEVLDTGVFQGRPADVVEAFSMSDRDAVVDAGVPTRNAQAGEQRKWMQPAVARRMFTPQSRQYLMQIRRAILAGTAIVDLQLLIKPGKVVVFDPAGIILKEEHPAEYWAQRPKNLAQIDRMLQYVP